MAAELPDKLFFRIGEVADLVGVEAHVLRYWESEFRIRPQRSNAGQRLFRRADVQKFMRVRQLLHDEGYTIAGARKSLAESAGEITLKATSTADADTLRDALRRVRKLRADIAALVADMGN